MAEEDLSTAEALIEALFAILPDAALEVDSEGVITRCNSPAEAMFSYPPGDLIGRRVEELVPLRLREGHSTLRKGYVADRRARPMGAGIDLFGQRADGSEFPVDISLAPVNTGDGTATVAIVHDLSSRLSQAMAERRLLDEVQRHRGWLEALSEMQSLLLSGTKPVSVLSVLAERAAALSGALGAMVAIPDAKGEDLDVISATGSLSTLKGSKLAGGASAAGSMYHSGSSIETGDLLVENPVASLFEGMDIGPALVVALRGVDRVHGTLSLVKPRGAEPFDEPTATMVGYFAGQAGNALGLANARLDREQIALYSDRDRIARDLHDRVIQRIFGAGLGLQAVAGRLTDETALKRVNHAIDELDDTIRELRTSIFELESSRPKGGQTAPSLREKVLEVTNRASEGLGFAPTVRFTGAIDTVIGESLASDILAVVREGLSNVAKYARARNVNVEVEITGSGSSPEAVVTVVDDGIGIGTPTRSSGLDNLRVRAESYGGSFDATNGEEHGTVLVWRASLS